MLRTVDVVPPRAMKYPGTRDDAIMWITLQLKLEVFLYLYRKMLDFCIKRV
jgi:hypothetical protein